MKQRKKSQEFKQFRNPSSLLPLQFGSLIIKKLQWTDFKGKIDQSQPYSAHIYWQIDYFINDQTLKQVSVSLKVGKKSWVIQQDKSDQLLQHQQGHYLICALCCLQFIKRVNQYQDDVVKNFSDLLSQIFDFTLKQYLIVEKQYDEQTDHYFNQQRQRSWGEFIYRRLQHYKQNINEFKVPKIGKIAGFLSRLKKLIS